jgi:hypothetical protein
MRLCPLAFKCRLRPSLSELQLPGGLIDLSHDWLGGSRASWSGDTKAGASSGQVGAEARAAPASASVTWPTSTTSPATPAAASAASASAMVTGRCTLGLPHSPPNSRSKTPAWNEPRYAQMAESERASLLDLLRKARSSRQSAGLPGSFRPHQNEVPAVSNPALTGRRCEESA